MRYAFETLDQVAQGSYTQWSIVYEVDRGGSISAPATGGRSAP